MGERTSEVQYMTADGRTIGALSECTSVGFYEAAEAITPKFHEGFEAAIVLIHGQIKIVPLARKIAQLVHTNNYLKMHGIPKRRRARHGIDSTHHNFYNT